jgi:hypothetical protein
MTSMSPATAPAPMGYYAGENPRPGADLIQAGYLAADNDPNGGDAAAKHGHFDHLSDQPPGYPFHGLNHGIVPTPAGSPPGAVAAIGAYPAHVPQQPINMRTEVNFASPEGMRVSWYGQAGWSEHPLITPARYNFLEAAVYRLRMSNVPNRLERVYYPTLEVLPAQEKTVTYLAHSSVPVTFTDEDFEQVDSGNFLVKVIYLPDPHNQDLAVTAGPNELVSTRLEPGIDPIVEAQRRGTILLIVRMGNIDLGAPNTPAMDAPNPYMGGGMVGVPRPMMGAPGAMIAAPGRATVGTPAMTVSKSREKKDDTQTPLPVPLPESVTDGKKSDDKKTDDKKLNDPLPLPLPIVH